MYVELMKLVPAFDAMYDAIESFEVWLGVSNEVELAKKRLTKIFEDAGMDLPVSKDELKNFTTRENSPLSLWLSWALAQKT